MTASSRILVLDFDGTVCLGDGPVYAYARLLDEALAGNTDDAADARQHPDGLVRRTVERFLSGDTDADATAAGTGTGTTAATGTATAIDTGISEPTDLTAALEIVANSVDGYAAAERLAVSRGITREQLSAAYTGSREELASGVIETHAPDGLADLLAGLPAEVRVVLVTNAPLTGVEQQLVHLGLDTAFDEVIASAGKPSHMRSVLTKLLDEQGLAASPERMLSVGDIWRNDLEPATALGCVTALIERLPAPAAAPTFRAPTIEQLYPAIIAWATAP